MFDEDVVDHIAKVLDLLDLIKIPGVDSHRPRMKVFPLSLADDARQWWINEGKEKLPLGKTYLFFKAHDKRDIEEGNELRQMKRKRDNKIDEQPNKRVCKAEKFEAIKYSLGPNEEYIADLDAKKSTKLVKYRSSGILCVIVVMLEYRCIYNTHPCS
ncbi:hypothetical protein Tco_0665020 [Tanacetum coccineum]